MNPPAVGRNWLNCFFPSRSLHHRTITSTAVPSIGSRYTYVASTFGLLALHASTVGYTFGGASRRAGLLSVSAIFFNSSATVLLFRQARTSRKVPEHSHPKHFTNHNPSCWWMLALGEWSSWKGHLNCRTFPRNCTPHNSNSCRRSA